MIQLSFIFIFGLIIGSFLNCVIWRIHKEESFIFGKSYCPRCKHDLTPRDLFPLLSFLILKGKCRYCKEKISFQYPLVELFTAFIFCFLYVQLGCSLVFLFWLILISLIIVIFVYDVKYYIIPDRAIFSAIGLSVLWIAYSYFSGILSSEQVVFSFFSAIGSALFFFSIWFFSKGMAMGFGDVKVAFLMGLILGWPNIIVGIFLGFLFGAIIGLGMVFLKKKALRSEVPFAPFLLTGMFIASFWGSNIVIWYLSLIN